MGQAQRKQTQATQADVEQPTTDGMTLAEMKETYQRLQQGLAELRQDMLRQEGAVAMMGELIRQREQAAQPEQEPEPEPEPPGDGEV